MNTSNSAARLIKSTVAGLIAGLLILTAFLAPSVVDCLAERAHAAIMQKNLISARGEVSEDMSTAEVSVYVVLDGVPQTGMSASVDHQNWYIPQNGWVKCSQQPGYYRHIAAVYENRIVWVERELIADGPNDIILDVGWAPTAPEFVMLEIDKEKQELIPLDIIDAEEIIILNAPNGVSVIRDSGAFSLLCEGSLLPSGFSHIALKAVNEAGYAVMHIGLRVPRSGDIIPIYTVEDLSNIRNRRSGSYILMNDLDMSRVDDWVEIGTGENPFVGVFDGGGHEIRGLHVPEDSLEGGFSLLGQLRNAEIKNLIIREPSLSPLTSSDTFVCIALCSNVGSSLIQNCAVVGGVVVGPACSGLAGNTVDSVIMGCFNSSRVFTSAPNSIMPPTGGIVSTLYQNSYLSNCANEGEVYGSHLTGGITSFVHDSSLYRCINSGYIWGQTLVGEILPGGIIHTTDLGFAAYGYFVRGSSPVGGNVFVPYGAVNSLLPIDRDSLRDAKALPLIGSFSGDNPDWTYASLDANGPVPYGIFKNQAEAPALPESGNRIVLPPLDGVRYYYTLDGRNPYTGCQEGVESLELTLSRGQTLTVFAARQGCRDSEIAAYQWEGGN